MADVGAMVEEAVHDFRSFVHSDCGGHGSCSSIDPPRVPGQPPPPPPEDKPCETPSDQALLRWTAHCVLGTMVRFHQGDHRFWLRDDQTQETARSYLNMRYKLAPSLIGWGRTVQTAGFPLTARCDLIWPSHTEANDPSQYIHLNATLIAPLEGDAVNRRSTLPEQLPASRSVWIPPGEWQDGWTGATVTGPKTMQVTPKESAGKFDIPMWHRRGSMLVTVADGATRIGEQDWSELTIEAWPDTGSSAISTRDVYEPDTSPHPDSTATTLALHTDAVGRTLRLEVGASRVARAWLVRLHLRRGEQLTLQTSDDDAVVSESLRHVQPLSSCADDFFPFAGTGTPPACEAGPIAEFRVAASRQARVVKALVQQTSKY
eukprot:COSAG01_NODE_2046_length_8561_cov_3.243441_8_plen_375_part_00